MKYCVAIMFYVTYPPKLSALWQLFQSLTVVSGSFTIAPDLLASLSMITIQQIGVRNLPELMMQQNS